MPRAICSEAPQPQVVDLYKFKPYVFELVEPVVAEGGSIPKPRSGHRIVCNDQNFYCYGGYNPLLRAEDLNDGVWERTRPLFKEVWRFNMTSRIWTKLEVDNIPHVLASNCMALQGSLIIVFGGTGMPFGNANSNDVYICDLTRSPLQFRFMPSSGNQPEPRYGQAIHIDGKYMYVFGGTTGFSYSSDVHRLDLQTMVWEECYICKGLAHEPRPGYRHEIAVDGRQVYILGGGTSDTSHGFRKLFVFNLDDYKWTAVETEGDRKTEDMYPRKRKFHSSVMVPGKREVIIMGGLDGSEFLGDTWKLDLVTLKWQRIDSMALPSPIDFHATSITPAGKVYSFGGVTSDYEHGKRIADVTTAWACIPNLVDMAWEAVQHYGLLSDARFLVSHILPPNLLHRSSNF
uniref:Kelch domain-containing protein 10 n=1 Tax=Lygus hesperus TaxID=30085 RepID=A0A0A9Z0Q3_LYGHE